MNEWKHEWKTGSFSQGYLMKELGSEPRFSDSKSGPPLKWFLFSIASFHFIEADKLHCVINTVSDEQAASEPNIRKLADKRKSEMVDFMCLLNWAMGYQDSW